MNSKVNKEKDIDIDIDELENLEKKNINFNWLLEEQPPSNFLADTNSDINESMKYFTFQKQKNQLPLKEIQKGNEFQKEKEKENDIEKEKIIIKKKGVKRKQNPMNFFFFLLWISKKNLK